MRGQQSSSTRTSTSQATCHGCSSWSEKAQKDTSEAHHQRPRDGVVVRAHRAPGDLNRNRHPERCARQVLLRHEQLRQRHLGCFNGQRAIECWGAQKNKQHWRCHQELRQLHRSIHPRERRNSRGGLPAQQNHRVPIGRQEGRGARSLGGTRDPPRCPQGTSRSLPCGTARPQPRRHFHFHRDRSPRPRPAQAPSWVV